MLELRYANWCELRLNNTQVQQYKQQLANYHTQLHNQGIDVDNMLRLGWEGNSKATYHFLQNPVHSDDNVQWLGKIINPGQSGTINAYYNGTVNGDFLKVTYTNLENSSYKGERIGKIIATYSNLIFDPNHKLADARYNALGGGSFPNNRKGFNSISIYKNIYLGLWIGNAKSVDVHLEFYDKNGNKIDLSDKGYVFAGSLNSYKWGDYVEKEKLLTPGSVIIPNGSKVKNHAGNIVYADERIDGIDENWENNHPIWGTAIFKANGNNVGIRYIADNKSSVGSGSWFYTRTSLNDVDAPLSAEIHYHHTNVALQH